jgi:histidyl-tRNA synthetase
VGSASDRPRYVQTLRTALEPVVARMCEDCQRRAVTNPLRVLDCKHAEDQPIIATLPRIWDSLDEGSKEHFAAVVRGLDYYTRTTFEFVSDDLGAQNALLGGGRYDGLSEAIGGPKAPGIGFAMGEDRLVLALQAQNRLSAELAATYIAPLGERTGPAALALAKELRASGLRVELGDGSFRLKKSLEAANKLSRTIVILGEDEVASGILTLKHFASREQFKVPRGQLGQKLAALLAPPPTSTSN